MYTKSDKEFMQQLHIEHPHIYERIVDIYNRSQSDLRIGCHDVSNIISLIYGNYQLISLNRAELSALPRWNILGNDIKHLIETMNSIGEYRYACSVEKSCVDAHTYITDTMNRLCNVLAIPTSNVRLNLDTAGCRINIDSNKISYVLKALILNIIEIDSDALINVDAEVSGDNLYISISDSVGGVSNIVEPRMFEPFNTDNATCAGMSLATSYRILLAHDGELTYAPNNNNGSTFTLSIPALI